MIRVVCRRLCKLAIYTSWKFSKLFMSLKAPFRFIDLTAVASFSFSMIHLLHIHSCGASHKRCQSSCINVFFPFSFIVESRENVQVRNQVPQMFSFLIFISFAIGKSKVEKWIFFFSFFFSSNNQNTINENSRLIFDSRNSVWL